MLESRWQDVKQLVSYDGSQVMADGVTHFGTLPIYYSGLG
jgi:hypothetical protein